MSDLKMERTFPAAPETVFDYLTNTEYLLQWWGPEGISVAKHNLDFSKPGPWHSTMTNAEGTNYTVSGEVVTVEAPRAVEFTWAWHDENNERGHESRVRFEVASDGNGGTRFTMTHSGLADEESAANHNGGWTSSFVKLERLLG
ncbi:MAG: SRPBCC domain-containing protein [Pseudomonadota bacterium]